MLLSQVQPFNLADHLNHQATWSARTFGPGNRTAGVLAHIKKELDEVEAKPDDLSEWIDVIILACDGALRRGYTGQQIVAAWQLKQAANVVRKWPDWRKMDPNKPIEHDRSGERQEDV